MKKENFLKKTGVFSDFSETAEFSRRRPSILKQGALPHLDRLLPSARKISARPGRRAQLEAFGFTEPGFFSLPGRSTWF